MFLGAGWGGGNVMAIATAWDFEGLVSLASWLAGDSLGDFWPAASKCGSFCHFTKGCSGPYRGEELGSRIVVLSRVRSKSPHPSPHLKNGRGGILLPKVPESTGSSQQRRFLGPGGCEPASPECGPSREGPGANESRPAPVTAHPRLAACLATGEGQVANVRSSCAGRVSTGLRSPAALSRLASPPPVPRPQP